MSDAHRKNINKLRGLKQQTKEMREQLLRKLDPKANSLSQDHKELVRETSKEAKTPTEVADLEEISTIEMENNSKEAAETQPELALDIEEDFWVQVLAAAPTGVEESAVLRKVKKGFWNWSSAQE